MKNKKIIFIHIGALALIGLLFLSMFSEKLAGSEIVTVSTTTSQKGTFYNNFNLTGEITYSEKETLAAPFTFTVEELNKEVGYLVEQGSIIATCKGYEVEAQILQMAENISKMYEKIDQLTNQVNTLCTKYNITERTVSEAGTINTGSITDLSEAERLERQHINEIRTLTIQRRLAEIDLTTAEETYQKIAACFNSDYNLISPISGRLTGSSLYEGKEVQIGDLLYEISQDDSMYAVFYANNSQASNIEEGDKVNTSVIVQKREANGGWISQAENFQLQVVKKRLVDDIYELRCDIKANSNQKISKQGLSTTVTKPKSVYSRLVPHSSVYSDSGSSYLYGVRTERKLFTVAHYVYKIDINVMDENEYYTAVSGYTLNGVEIVLSAEGELRDGQRVRIEN